MLGFSKNFVLDTDTSHDEKSIPTVKILDDNMNWYKDERRMLVKNLKEIIQEINIKPELEVIEKKILKSILTKQFNSKMWEENYLKNEQEKTGDLEGKVKELEKERDSLTRQLNQNLPQVYHQYPYTLFLLIC